MLVLVLNLIYLAVILAVHAGDEQVFVTRGQCFSECHDNPGAACDPNTLGYDGQFFYYIARDPAESPHCLDVPAYRLQRILLPMLGRVLTLGYEPLSPWAVVAINVAALTAGTALLEDLLVREKVSRWFALTYGLFLGVFMAVRLSTAETLAYGLVIAGLWFSARERLLLTAVMLALAMLAKETTGLFAAGYLFYLALHARWHDALRMAVIVGAPFAVWQLVIYLWLGHWAPGSGGAGATPFEIIPYNAVWRSLHDPDPTIAAILALLLLPTAVLPSMLSLIYTVRDFLRRRWDLYACLLFFNALIMLFLPFSTYRTFLGLLRFMPGLVLAFVLYTARHQPHRPLVYSTLWIVLLLFLEVG